MEGNYPYVLDVKHYGAIENYQGYCRRKKSVQNFSGDDANELNWI